VRAGIALRENDVASPELRNLFGDTCRREEGFSIEPCLDVSLTVRAWSSLSR